MTEGRRLAGLAIAASAAALLVAGCAATGESGSGATSAKVICQGANACKGLSDCKTANSACAGQNECKGTGFVKLSAEACGKVGGRVG